MENESKRDMEDIAGRLRSVFAETMEALELDRLNETVKNTIGAALDEAREEIERQREKLENARWRRQTEARVPSGERTVKKPLEIRVNWKGKVSGILFTVFGAVGLGIFGLTALAPLAVVLTSPHNGLGWWTLGMCTVIAGGFGGMLAAGVGRNGRVNRLKQYVKELKQWDRPYCQIEKLSRSCQKKPKFVRKDLRKILRLGMLPDARMDEKEEWLMLDAETYRQYQLSQEALEHQKKEEKRQQSKGQERPGGTKAQTPGEDGPVEQAIRQGEAYMETLDKLRDSMKEEPAAQKLVRLDAVLESLFETLKKYPQQLPELEKLMEYYLPTTVKLVATYHEFALVEFPGDNIKEAKNEIEQTLDTINKAFEKLLDRMYEDAAFDVITDAAVLQKMLAREGMTEGDFS